jgi:hypothetical protein
VTYDDHGSFYETASGVFYPVLSSETISDWVNSRHDVNYVYHAKASVDVFYAKDRHAGGWIQYMIDYPLYQESDPLVPLTWIPSPSDSLLSSLADDAFEALVPQVPQEVSIPNFLYELREIGDLIPALDDSLSKTVSGGYLTYSFGWKPLVGDLQKLGRLIDTVSKRIDYLKSTYGRETRISFYRKLDTYDLGVSPFVPDPINGGAGFVKLQGIYRAGGYLFHKLEGLDGLNGMLRGCSAALGLNNPLGVLWEAIPYSFVADWFGRTQSLLSQQALQPFVGTWDLRRMSHSVSIEGIREYWIPRLSSVYEPPWNAAQLAAIQRVSSYTRSPGLPAASTWLTSTQLGSQQQLLASALIRGVGR